MTNHRAQPTASAAPTRWSTRWSPSIAIFRESLAAAEEQSDPAETVRFAVLLANAFIDADDFARRRGAAERTVSLAPDSKDPIFRARVYWSHSRLHTLQGDPVLAARTRGRL